MNDRSRMMTYALIATACIIWIWESVKGTLSGGAALDTTTIVFLVCIGIAAIYCIVSALILWWRQPGRNNEEADTPTDASDGQTSTTSTASITSTTDEQPSQGSSDSAGDAPTPAKTYNTKTHDIKSHDTETHGAGDGR